MNTYWLKQEPDVPLFPDLIWSRPENKAQSGKLLIAGGNSHAFSAVATAYSKTSEAGIGQIKILLPDALKKMVGVMPDTELAPSTPSGSFAVLALAQALDLATWSDGVLLAGDFGKNSETTIFLESFLSKYSGPLALCGDSLDNLMPVATTLFKRPKTCIVPSVEQLQKLVVALSFDIPILNNSNLLPFIENLHKLCSKYPMNIVIQHQQNFIVASSGKISSTKFGKSTSKNTEVAAYSTVWWLQNPTKPFEALTSALYEISN